MRLLLAALALIFSISLAYAGDWHDDDETHTVIYLIVDSNGNHVAGETVRLTLVSSDLVHIMDFNDSTWNTFANATTKHATMNENADVGFYYYTITMDSATLQSGDVVVVVSNDSASYGDLQGESISFSNIKNFIKIYR